MASLQQLSINCNECDIDAPVVQHLQLQGRCCETVRITRNSMQKLESLFLEDGAAVMGVPKVQNNKLTYLYIGRNRQNQQLTLSIPLQSLKALVTRSRVALDVKHCGL